MSVTEIRDLLDDRFRLLSGGSRRMRQRQATLEGAVQWSYDLLTPAEQSILQTLSVFQGASLHLMSPSSDRCPSMTLATS
jgi:predicted ATPase